MRLYLLFSVLLSKWTTAAGWTVVPRVLSKKETEYYRQQGLRPVTVDRNIVDRMRSTLSMDVDNVGELLEVSESPSSKSISRKSRLKGLRTRIEDKKSAAYIVLDNCDTDTVKIESGSLLVFESNEMPHEILPAETRILGPLHVSNRYKRHLAKKDEKKTKKKDKNSSSRDTDDSLGPPTTEPSALPSSFPSAQPTRSPSIEPSAAPSSTPTTINLLKLYHGPCVCELVPEGCWQCQGMFDDCIGDCV